MKRQSGGGICPCGITGSGNLGKLVIYTGKADISATELAERLRNSYNIEIEMVAAEYVLAMTTVAAHGGISGAADAGTFRYG